MPTDPELLSDDVSARAAALDTARSFIVQAPAGSGKTELLIQRYLCLLAEVDAPEEVLAITFTRKAAAEMQVRVLAALRRSAAGQTPVEPHLKITARAAEAVLARSEALGWEVESNPRRLRIQTLDSLNAAIARMQPLTTSASTFGSSVGEDAELKALYRRAAAATLDWLAESGPLADATREVLLHLDTNTSVYVAYLARMLETRDQWLPFVSAGEIGEAESAALRREFEASLGKTVTSALNGLVAEFGDSRLQSLRPLLDYAATQLRSSGDASPLTALEAVQFRPGRSAGDLGAWQELTNLLQTQQGMWRKTVNKNQGFPPAGKEQKSQMLEQLESLRDDDRLRGRLHSVKSLPPCEYQDDQWQVLLALFRLLPLAVAELHRLFGLRGVTDYIEIALTAAEALGTAESPGDIALLLDYQVRHILVDEMQDTSRAQYRMLEALTGGWQDGDGRTLFCVGDPMQSIYRFRNAEVAQFLLARQKGIASMSLETLILRQNFRSGEHLVDWFNRTFSRVLPDTDEPAQGAVAYSASVAVPGHAGQGAVTVNPLFGSDVGQEADAALQCIRRLLEAHVDDDIAVLVRSRTQLSRLLARLREQGIAYQAIDIDRLTDLPEIIDILAITRAIVHPGDRVAWLAVLRSPAIGLDWSDLLALVHNDAQSTIPELLDDAKRIASLSEYGRAALARVAPMLDAMLASHRAETLRERVERVWLELGGAAIAPDRHAVDNVYRYLDVLDTLEVAGTLEDVAELEAQLDLERVSSEVDARLKVMTMHRAKGLQFDHVLLYGLGRIPRQAERSVLSWFDIPDEHGNEHKVLSPVGPRAELARDPIHRFIELSEAAKDANEQARLLYVACTRARKSLHLLGHTKLAAEQDEIRAPDPRSLLALLWPELQTDYEQAFDNARPAAVAGSDEQWLRPRLRRLAPGWTLPDVRALPVQEATGGPDVAPRVDYDWVGHDARAAGTIVHRWLQLAAEGRVRLQREGLADLRADTGRWLGAMGIAGDRRQSVLARVEQALAALLDDDRADWLLLSEGHAELELSGIYAGSVVSIVIDRVVVDADAHWLIDYKTSTHEGGDLDGFLAAEADRYRPQLERYASVYAAWSGQVPRCALYFPLLGRLVEVATTEALSAGDVS